MKDPQNFKFAAAAHDGQRAIYYGMFPRSGIRVIDYELMQLRWWQGLSWDESDNLLCFNNYIIKLINTRCARVAGGGSGPSNVVMRCLSNLCKSQQNFWHTSSVHSRSVRRDCGAIVWLLWVASNYQHDIKYIKITLDTRGRGGRESNGGTHATCWGQSVCHMRPKDKSLKPILASESY